MLRRHSQSLDVGISPSNSAQQRPELMLRRHGAVVVGHVELVVRSTKAGAYDPATPGRCRGSPRWGTPLNKGRSLCSGDTTKLGTLMRPALGAQQRPELMLRRHWRTLWAAEGKGNVAQQKAGAYAPATPASAPAAAPPRPALNKGRSLCSGDTTFGVPPMPSRMAAQQRPELMLRRHSAGCQSSVSRANAQQRPELMLRRHAPLVDGLLNAELRSTKAGAYAPATLHGSDRLHGAPPPLNKGRSLCSGDTGDCLPASIASGRRSTKAGAYAPATLDCGAQQQRLEQRSTKAGAYAPATPGAA